MSVALLSSPFLGPAVWEPVARVLAEEGWHTMVCGASGEIRTAPDAMHSFLAELPSDEDLLLVPHSNAGAFVPGLTSQRRVVGVVFVDAILPPSAGPIRLAAPEFVEMLRSQTDERGLMPAWTQWWPPAEIAPLFPNVDSRAIIEQEQRSLPLSYLTDVLPAPAGWDVLLPMAYLAFGEAYDAERLEAELRGWPVASISGGHLHQLIDPEQVAAEIVGLARRCGITSPK